MGCLHMVKTLYFLEIIWKVELWLGSKWFYVPGSHNYKLYNNSQLVSVLAVLPIQSGDINCYDGPLQTVCILGNLSAGCEIKLTCRTLRFFFVSQKWVLQKKQIFSVLQANSGKYSVPQFLMQPRVYWWINRVCQKIQETLQKCSYTFQFWTNKTNENAWRSMTRKDELK